MENNKNYNELPNINDENEKEYWAEFKKTLSPQIKAALVKKYATLVKYAADRLKPRIMEGNFAYLDDEDLVSFGYSGLSDAIDNYNLNIDVEFITYAIIRIEEAIYDELRKIDSFPKRIRREIRTINNARKILEIKLKGNATPEEIAEMLEITIDDYRYIMSYILTLPETSLYEISRYIDDRINPEYLLEKKEFKKEFINILKKLPKQEFDVLKLYHYEGLTLKEIGKKLGISEIKVSKTYWKAIQNLRQIYEEINS